MGLRGAVPAGGAGEATGAAAVVFPVPLPTVVATAFSGARASSIERTCLNGSDSVRVRAFPLALTVEGTAAELAEWALIDPSAAATGTTEGVPEEGD